MRRRRIVCFLLGIWIGASAMLAVASYENFRALDALLKSPPEQAAPIIKTAGRDSARALLRYAAGAGSGDTFEIWEEIQFAIAFLIAAILFIGPHTRGLAAIPAAMGLLVTLLHFTINPEVAWLARSVEFAPWTADSHPGDQFWNLHRIYVAVDSVKCLLGIGLAVLLFSGRSARNQHPRRRVDATPRPDFSKHTAL